MATNSTPEQEEVDLGKLLILLGNGVKYVFNSILNFLKYIFHLFILVLLFFKKNLKYYLIALVLGFIIGYLLEKKETPSYYSEMVVATNFKFGHQLYNNIDFINSLLQSKNYQEVAKIFKIPKAEAQELKSFLIEPYEREKNLELMYDKYIKKTDTIYTFAQNFTIKDFKKRVSNPDFKKQKITVTSNKNLEFNKLTEAFSNIKYNDYYQRLDSITKEKLQRKKSFLTTDLSQMDSLREVYKKVAILSSQNQGQAATRIDLGEKGKTINPEIELFDKRIQVLNYINEVENLILEESYIMKVVSKFTKGKIKNNFFDKKTIKLPFLFLLVSIIITLLLKMNNFLENYKEN